MRRVVVLAAAALAIVLCGGCRDGATPSSGPSGDTTGFDQVETTLSSIEADVNQP